MPDSFLGPYASYCAGAPCSPGSSYVAAPIVSFGCCPVGASRGLDQIVAFDYAESEWARLTQTNLIRVSSFCGPRGALLGRDLLPTSTRPCSLLARSGAWDGRGLLLASRALLGCRQRPGFSIAPGEHVLSAYKTAYAEGPCLLVAGIAIAVPRDRLRHAVLFMEDHASHPSSCEPCSVQQEMAAQLWGACRQVGQNLDCTYQGVYLAIRSRAVPGAALGCSLTAIPYLLLARQVVPSTGAERLTELSPRAWRREVGLAGPWRRREIW